MTKVDLSIANENDIYTTLSSIPRNGARSENRRIDNSTVSQGQQLAAEFIQCCFRVLEPHAVASSDVASPPTSGGRCSTGHDVGSSVSLKGRRLAREKAISQSLGTDPNYGLHAADSRSELSSHDKDD
jgi:hypothetical protein